MTKEPKRTYEDDNGPLTPEQLDQIKDLSGVDNDVAWSCTYPDCMTGREDSYSGCTGACV